MANLDPIPPGPPDDHLAPPGRLGRLLVREFAPGLRPYLTRWQRPSRVLGLAAGASLLCGMFLHPQGFIPGLGLLAAVALGLVWPTVGVRGLVGEVRFEATRVREGDALVAHSTLRNRAPWGAWALTVDPGTGSGATIPLVGPGRTARHRLDLVASRRGVVGAGSARVASGFPFGFRHATRPLRVARELVIWPGTVPVGPIPLASGDVTSVGPVAGHRVGGSGDFAGVRPYRRGDPVRRVHWGQTARLDALMVVERQAETRPEALVVLDADPAVHAGTGPDSSREWAIRVAASLIGALLDRGVRVEAILGDAPLGLLAAPDPRRRANDALAHLADQMLPLGPTLLGAPWRRCRGTRIVVTTDRSLRALAAVVSDPADLWVVLLASGFDPMAGPVATEIDDLPVRPWVVIAGPDDLAQLRGPSRRPSHAA